VFTRGVLLVILLFLALTASSGTTLYRLPAEPLIRVGLSTNSNSVTITTNDSSLVSFAPDEAMKLLGTSRVTVAARVYRPPEIDEFRIEFQNFQTQAEANDLAKDIREATGETALVSVDIVTALWKVWVGSVKATSEEADLLKAQLTEKGFDDAVVVQSQPFAQRILRNLQPPIHIPS